MTTITLPHTFVDGSAASSDNAMENFYNPDSPNQSFEALNGYLDNVNRAPGWGELGFRHIRQRAFSSGQMVGKTEPTDFMGGASDGSVFNPGTASDGEAFPAVYEPISGASIEFYLPDDPTAVVFTWQVFVGTDASFTASAAGTAQAFLYFFIDGVAQTETKRELPLMFCDHTLSGGAGTYNFRRQRVYSGHCIKTNLTAGWHSASLRIWSSANLARVRVRNMKYIRLK